MPRNKVVVKINGSEYSLVGDENEDYLFSIANYLDKKIKETLLSNPKHSTTSAAVLTALTVTDALFKDKKEIEALKKQIQEPEDKIKELKEEYDKLHEAYLQLSSEYKKFKDTEQVNENNISDIKEEYNKVYENYMDKNEECRKLSNENEILKGQDEQLQAELDEKDNQLLNFKDQLLESQIELVRVKKELKDRENKDLQYKKRNL